MEPVQEDHTVLSREAEPSRSNIGGPSSVEFFAGSFLLLLTWKHAAMQTIPSDIANELFQAATYHLGEASKSLGKITEDNIIALAAIAAEGDRIDRLNSENRTALKLLESPDQ